MAKNKKAASKKKAVKPAAKASKKTAKKAVKKSAKKAGKPKPKKKREDLNCFLTTACVRYYGLPDDGYELNTLRNFRDSYLASDAAGKKLIAEYYEVSPLIVERIEKDAQKESAYSYIHERVLRACREIDEKELLAAKKTYVDLVEHLKQRYLS